MHPGAKIMMVVAVAVLAAGPAFAGDKDKGQNRNSNKSTKNQLVIKGKVLEDGKPQMAEIRVKSLDRKMPDKVVQTDSKGKFIVLGLEPGNYSVTAHEEGTNYPRSRAVIKVDRYGWANVTFDMGLDKDAGNDASRIGGYDHLTEASSHMGSRPTFKR
jgi:hypothetical protein